MAKAQLSFTSLSGITSSGLPCDDDFTQRVLREPAKREGAAAGANPFAQSPLEVIDSMGWDPAERAWIERIGGR